MTVRIGRLRSTLFIGAALAINSGSAAEVDVNRANDYYGARQSSAVAAAELYHLGPCEKRLGERDYPRAMGECGFILKIFPNHPTALLLTAQICEQWKSPKCMLDDAFERAVSINPKAPGTYVVQGIHFHRTSQYAKAIQSFNYALELDPDQMNAHYNIALTYLETKQFDLANTHAQRAYALGATLPGLRDRLTKAGYWKPSEQGAEAPAQAKVPAPAQTKTPADTAGSR
jgi:tetratricopeptide (TPR) repeat protein